LVIQGFSRGRIQSEEFQVPGFRFKGPGSKLINTSKAWNLKPGTLNLTLIGKYRNPR